MSQAWEPFSFTSVTWSSLILSCSIAAAFLLLLGYAYSEEEGAATFEVAVPNQLKPDYPWDWSCLQDGVDNTPEIHDGKIHPHCPADGRSLGDPLKTATTSDIDDAVQRATAAQPKWAETTFPQRRRVLRTLLEHILAHQDEIVHACCLDSGKTQVDACFGEILVTAEKLQWTIKHGEEALRPSRRPTNLLMRYKKNTVRYEPLGVVAACVSWNYPFHNFISPVISALFSGNAIVVKPSEQTCWSATYFLRIIRDALAVCGHNQELVQNVLCLPDVADHLTSHADLGHITFIGSRTVAFKVVASAAQVLTPVTVELGGKDPAIVLDDAKTLNTIDDVCAILLRGTFQSAGQNCIGIERVIALPKAHDQILDVVKPKVQAMRLGSITHTKETLDMGAMISSSSFSRLENLIQSAVQQGATLHHGGRRLKHPIYPNGHYFQPTLLSNITADMEIAQVELFAPVFLLMKANTVQEAVSIANSTPYGLGASVFGHKGSETKYCVRNIKSGMVAVNDFGAYYACSLPFGGTKGSGYGRFGGEEGLRGLCSLKAVCEDAAWARWLGVQTRIPGLLQYPIEDGRKAWEMCKGVVEVGYAMNWGGRGRGLFKLVGAMMAGERVKKYRTRDISSP